METSQEIRQFLTALRGRLSPERAGITHFTGERRVPGLRREEVAQLAGVSTAYYTRMERGDLAGVSESVLHALVNALELDDAESAHLFDLARAATGPQRSVRMKPEPRLTARLTQLLEAMPDVPAIAMTRLGTPAGANRLGRALFPHLFPQSAPPVNHARYLFRDPRAHEFYPDWERSALETVSSLRLLAGRDPSDRALMALVGELATHNVDFRTWWAGHTVRTHTSGTKTLNHPVVGEITIGYDSLAVRSIPDLSISTYLPEPATASADALDLLRSWIAEPVHAVAEQVTPVTPSPSRLALG